jgi:hypothetical protein
LEGRLAAAAAVPAPAALAPYVPAVPPPPSQPQPIPVPIMVDVATTVPALSDEIAPATSPEPSLAIEPETSSGRTLPPLRPTSGTTQAPPPRKAGAADAARAQLGTRSTGTNGEPKARMGAGPGVPATPAAPKAEVPAAVGTTATIVTSVDGFNANLEAILESVGGRARAVFRVGRFDWVANGIAVMSVPNAAHLERAREVESELANTLAAQFGGMTLQLRSDDDGPYIPAPSSPSLPASPAATEPDDFADEADIDLHDLVDAPDDSGNTALDQITAMFPGSEVVE